MKHSVVISAYNEVESVEELYREVVSSLESLGETFEILFVDDGSTDGTGERIAELERGDRRVRMIRFVRNFGKSAAYSAAFKNIMDWISRLEKGIWSNKPMLLMATSPGGRGGKSVLEIAENSFPRRGANVIASFSLPSFNDNFDEDRGITDEALLEEFKGKLDAFKKVILES